MTGVQTCALPILTETTEKMQKLTDKMIEKVDRLVEDKTKEIMTV